jgi:dynein heavy chain
METVSIQMAADVPFAENDYRGKVSTVFADMHMSVINASQRMLSQLKRHNYVTATNYLELVKGYRLLLSEKTGESPLLSFSSPFSSS